MPGQARHDDVIGGAPKGKNKLTGTDMYEYREATQHHSSSRA